jgi:biopolymer transport protein ExbD
MSDQNIEAQNASESAAPASAAVPGFEPAPEGAIKEKKKRPVETIGSSLSIDSLMDIMTILLVFLLKSYSADPVQIKQAPGLSLPFATSELKPEEATAITITSTSITVDDKKVVALEDGKPNQADIAGDHLIQPLLDSLVEAVDHQKRIGQMNKKEFSGIVTVVADRHMSFNMLIKIMYTAGQAQFSKYKFAVIKS